MNKDAITFPTLIARLERAIHNPCGEHGFQILLYGWITKYGKVSRVTLGQRHSVDGEFWLSFYETMLFSKYAGYDLTHD
jgi:hypothetical protein